MNYKKALFKGLLLTQICGLYGQSISDSNPYKWYDSVVGLENSALHNAVAYVDSDLVLTNNNKFLFPNSFPVGTLVYEGQQFFDVPLNYNVYDDSLIAQLSTDSKRVVVTLFTDRLERFTIGEMEFLNPAIHLNKPELSETGFFEILKQSNGMTLLKKHRKKRYKRLNNKEVSYEFLTIKSEYYVLYDSGIHKVRNKRDFIRLFPDIKKEKEQLAVSNRMKRNDPDRYMIQLFTSFALL